MKSYGLENESVSSLTEIDEALLIKFANEENLSKNQIEQFKAYLINLVEWNKKFNITTLTSVQNVILYHFQDSIKLREFVDISSFKGIADIGSGGGFPGIPLKICFPEVPMVLIEVNKKKIQFLEHIIVLASLPKIEVCPFDWRTFLRKAEYEVDLFCARASLEPQELIRMFKPSCIYRKATLVYWASLLWHADSQEKVLLKREEPYVVGNKKRKFVFFTEK